MSKYRDKRKIELSAIRSWIADASSVLDLGCGRGLLLEELMRTKRIYAVGVDLDFDKITRAIRRGVNVIHGDILKTANSFADKSFDWVVCSRTLPELGNPDAVIKEALRVGNHVAVGFVNYGFWLNRLKIAFSGSRVLNEVYPEEWSSAVPTNDISVESFEKYCADNGIVIEKRHFLKGNWQSPCKFMPNLFAGYAIFEISKK